MHSVARTDIGDDVEFEIKNRLELMFRLEVTIKDCDTNITSYYDANAFDAIVEDVDYYITNHPVTSITIKTYDFDIHRYYDTVFEWERE